MRKRHAVVLAAGMLGFFGGIPQLFGQPVQIYSSGDFKDPVPLTTDLSYDWAEGVDFTSPHATLAESFSLPSVATIESVHLWTYDTTDGSAGVLTKIQYSIYAGGLQPTGNPIAAGFGNITSSTLLSGHSAGDQWDALGQVHQGLQTIASDFKLAAPAALGAGTTYWLSISAFTDPRGPRRIPIWAGATGDAEAVLGGSAS